MNTSEKRDVRHLLQACNSLLAALDLCETGCSSVHHSRHHRHAWLEDCPVELRIVTAIDNAKHAMHRLATEYGIASPKRRS